MIQKKKLFKNLLATASTMAVLIGGAQMAGAITVNTNGNVDFAANIAAGVAGNGLDAGFTSATDDLAIDANARVLLLNKAGLDIVGIDLATHNATATLTQNTIISGAISNPGTLAVTYGADGKTLTLGDATNKGLSVNFGGYAAAELILDAATTINQDVTTGGVAKGIITVNQNSIFSNDIGTAAQSLATFALANGKTLTLQGNGTNKVINVNAVTFANNAAQLIIGNTNNNLAQVTFGTDLTTGKVQITGSKTMTVDVNTGAGFLGTNGAKLNELDLNHSANAVTVAVASNATAAKVSSTGTTNFNAALNATTLAYSSTGTVHLKANSAITTTDFASNAGNLILDGVTVTGGVTNTVGAGGNIEVLGAGGFSAAVGTTNAINALKLSAATGGAAAATVTIGGALNTVGVEFNNAGAGVAGDIGTTLDLTAAAPTALGTVTNSSGTALRGKIKLGHSYTVANHIGANAAELSEISLGGGATTLSVQNNKNVYARVTSAANDDILAIAGTSIIYGVGTSAADKLATVQAGAGAVTFKAAVFADTVSFNGNAGDLTFEGNLNANVDFNGNAKKVILGNNANFTGDVTNVGDIGTLEFAGNSTATIGAMTNILDLISAGANGTVVSLGGPVATIRATDLKFAGTGTVSLYRNFTGNVDFQAKATATFNVGDNVTITGPINNTGAGAATGKVVYDGDAIVTGVSGSAQNLELIKLSGGAGTTVELRGDTKSDSIVFDNNAGSSTLFINAADLTLGGIVKTNNAGKGILKINKTQTLAHDIGEAAAGLEALIVEQTAAAAEVTLSMANTTNIFAHVKTDTNGKNNLVIPGAATVTAVGENAAKFNNVTVGANGAVAFTNAVYTDSLTIAGAHNITLSGGLDATNLDYGANDVTVTVAEDQIFKANTLGTGLGAQGTLELNGTRTIAQDLGTNLIYLKTLALKGGADKTVTIDTANVISKAITTDAGTTIKLNRDATVGVAGGTIDLSGATLNVGSNTLTTAAAPTFTAATTLIFEKQGDRMGSVDNSGNAVAVNLPDGMTISLLTDGRLKKDQKFIIIKAGAIPTVGEIVINDNDLLKNAEFIVEGNNLVLKVIEAEELDVVLEKTAERKGIALSSASKSFMDQLDKFADNATGDATKAIDEMIKIYNFVGEEQYVKAAARFAPNVTALQGTRNIVSSVVSQITSSAVSSVAARVASLESNKFAQAEGVAAGDSESKLGLWFKGFGGQGRQKMRKSESGYKSQIGGATVGFDMNFSDALMAGLAFTHAEANLKHKDLKAGDKTNAKSNFVTAYTSYDLGFYNMFVQGAVNAGSTKVISKDQKILSTGTVVADGRFDVFTYGLSALLGYNYSPMSNFVITPMAAVHYQKFLEGDYTETGAGILNQKILKRNYDKITGKAGVKVAMDYKYGDVTFTPELHGFINHDFKAKGAKIESTMDGLGGTITTKGAKPDANAINLGLGLTAKNSFGEIGFEYNAEKRSKYIGHEGSLKLKVNL